MELPTFKILVMSLSPATRQRRTLRLVLPLALAVTGLCGAQTEATRDLFLPSGKLIRVLTVSRLRYKQGTALVLKYQTDLSVSDLHALRKEIDQIWPVFRGDVEKAKLTTAIISANETPQGVVLKSGAAHFFMFRKIDGTWQLVSDIERPADRSK
jgi:hypothetical protein